jgi:hypothetical protein
MSTILTTFAGAVIIAACIFAIGVTWAAFTAPVKTDWEDDDDIP